MHIGKGAKDEVGGGELPGVSILGRTDKLDSAGGAAFQGELTGFP